MTHFYLSLIFCFMYSWIQAQSLQGNIYPASGSKTVYLYKHNPTDQTYALDQFYTTSTYYYSFNATSGQYIIKVAPANNQYLPTYSGNIAFSHSASKRTPSSVYDSLDISLIAADANLGTGTGTISGNINGSCTGCKIAANLENIQILLLDHNGVPLKSTLSDASGNYTFGYLPMNTYKVYVEIASPNAHPAVNVTLSDANPVNVDFEVNDGVVTEKVLGNKSSKSLSISVSVYPNPAEDYFNISTESTKSFIALIKVTNAMGIPLHSFNQAFVVGKNDFTLTTEDLPSGMYYLIVEDFNGGKEAIRVSKK